MATQTRIMVQRGHGEQVSVRRTSRDHVRLLTQCRFMKRQDRQWLLFRRPYRKGSNEVNVTLSCSTSTTRVRLSQ